MITSSNVQRLTILFFKCLDEGVTVSCSNWNGNPVDGTSSPLKPGSGQGIRQIYYLEVFYQHIWRPGKKMFLLNPIFFSGNCCFTVCSYGWTSTNTKIACRQLGFKWRVGQTSFTLKSTKFLF